MDKNTLDDLVSEILASMMETSGGDALRLDYLPDKGEVVNIIELLRKLLFPGYFDEEDIDVARTENHIRGLLTQVSEKLQRQICSALNLTVAADEPCEPMYEGAVEISSRFLSKIPELREILLTDVRAACDGDPAASSEHEIIFAYPGIFAISIYRIAHELHLLSVPLIPRMMTEYAHSLTGIDIHPGAEISHHFFIDHGTGVVVGETTEIGANVKLYQGVTLGALSTRGGQSLRGKKRHPTIEDEVTIYSGASILGGETVIGRGSIISGNAFVTHSVPPNTRVTLKDPELNFRSL